MSAIIKLLKRGNPQSCRQELADDMCVGADVQVAVVWILSFAQTARESRTGNGREPSIAVLSLEDSPMA